MQKSSLRLCRKTKLAVCILRGTMSVPHSKDKTSPRENERTKDIWLGEGSDFLQKRTVR